MRALNAAMGTTSEACLRSSDASTASGLSAASLPGDESGESPEEAGWPAGEPGAWGAAAAAAARLAAMDAIMRDWVEAGAWGTTVSWVSVGEADEAPESTADAAEVVVMLHR